MGILVGIDVEEEDISKVEGHIDRKPLADVVAGWIWLPGVVNMLGLSSGSADALKRINMNAFANSPLLTENDRSKMHQDVWQDPRNLKVALEELRVAFEKIRSTPSLMNQMETGEASDHFDRDSLELGAYEDGIEDAIRMCEWAAKLGKRVKNHTRIEKRC